MKQLFLKDGTILDVTIFENEHQRSIQVREDEFINYEVSKGNSVTEQYLFLGDTTDQFKIWEAKNAIEIYDHFEQYWKFLTIQKDIEDK